jgi:hypothetical protein
MAGEIVLAIAGRTAKLVFLGDHIVLSVGDYLTAVAFSRFPSPNLSRLGRLLAFSEIGLQVQVGNRKPVEIYPNPSRSARWLSPKIRELAGSI